MGVGSGAQETGAETGVEIRQPLHLAEHFQLAGGGWQIQRPMQFQMFRNAREQIFGAVDADGVEQGAVFCGGGGQVAHERSPSGPIARLQYLANGGEIRFQKRAADHIPAISGAPS